MLLGASSPHAAHLARDYHRSELHDTRGLSVNNNPAQALEGQTTAPQPESDSSRDSSAVASYGLGGALAAGVAAAANAPANAVRSALRAAQSYFTGSGRDREETTTSANETPDAAQIQQQRKPVNEGDAKAAARAAEMTMAGRSSYADLSELPGAGSRSGTMTPTHTRSPRVSELGQTRDVPPTVVMTGGQNIVVAGGPGILSPGGPALAAGAGPGMVSQVGEIGAVV